MRAMGSIWTAIFSFMVGSASWLGRGRSQGLASNAANRWRGKSPRCNQHDVETQLEFAMFGMRHQPRLCRIDDAPLLARRHRIGGLLETGAGLDLDKDHEVAAAGDQVDLAKRRAKTPGQDPIALGDQIGRGAHLGGNAGSKCREPLRRSRFRLRRHGPAVIRLGHHRLPHHGPGRAAARGHRSRGAAGRTIRPHAPPRP